MTIRVTYEDTETGRSETVELPDDDFIVLCGRANDVVEAMFHGIARRNGLMREFRAGDLAQQAFDGLLAVPTLMLSPVGDVQREEAHMAMLKATLLFRDYVSQALHGLPEAKRAQARELAVELDLLES